MKEHLTIRNFGPIRDAEITVRDLTVFVGPQATGKSLAAQVLYFLRGFESSPPPYVMPESEGALETVLSALEWWFGNAPSVYANAGAQLQWDSVRPTRKTTYRIWWDADSAHLSDDLESRMQSLMDVFGVSLQDFAKVLEKTLQAARQQIYMPAGRTLYSFVPPDSRFYVILAQRWPGYISMFQEILRRAIEQLWVEQLAQLERPEPDFIQQRMKSIVLGQIESSPAGTIMFRIGQKLLHSTTVAAGQMEMWPFWVIMDTRVVSNAQIYLEEPEAHLHPGAQRSAMETISYLMNHYDTQFLLTTHSPYILYAVNNFLMAQKVLDAGKTLPEDVPQETALHPEQVAAYRFSPDGTVHDIMDAEVGLIDEDELDDVADELGATFMRLQEKLVDVE
jgi:hypothetical protein